MGHCGREHLFYCFAGFSFLCLGVFVLVSVQQQKDSGRRYLHSPQPMGFVRADNHIQAKPLNSKERKRPSSISKEEAVNLKKTRLSDEELLARVVGCRSEHPALIYYNRVPKCASSSMLHYMDMNSKFGTGCKRFLQYSYDPYKTVNHPIKNPHRLYLNRLEKEYRVKEMLENAPAIYDSHTAFLSYFKNNAHKSATGYGDISYINVLRDPLARLISLKKYMCKTESRLCNATALDLFKKSSNWQIAYLCGHQAECIPRDETSLYIAKYRLVKTYSLVGISERLEETVKLLRKIFPDFFTLDYDGAQENRSGASNFTQFSKNELELYERYNKNDIEIYQFAIKVFDKKLKLCGLN